VVSIITIYCLLKYLTRLPKLSFPSKRNEYTKVNHDRFLQSKIPTDDLDCIIIGSGIAGLTCAGLLSRLGKKVLVLEQHYLAGGTTHVFEPDDYTDNEPGSEEHKSDSGSPGDNKPLKFETGCEYIGKLSNFNQKLLNFICEKPIEFTPMDEIFDVIHISNKQYNIYRTYPKYTAELIKHFPDEKDNIIRFSKLVRSTAKQGGIFYLFKIFPSCLRRFLTNILLSYFSEYINKSTTQVINEITDNQDLRAVLTGQFADYGSSPDTCPFQFASQVLDHYISDGGYYMKDGTDVVAKAIIPVIEKAGGRVLTGKKVKRILLEEVNDGEQAVGVEMENGFKIYSKFVISACGIERTIKSLIPETNLTVEYIDRMRTVVDNLSDNLEFMFLFIGVDDNKHIPSRIHSSRNVWYWPSNDHTKMMNNYYKNPLNSDMPLFISTRENSNSVIVLTLAKWQWFEKWQGERHKHRSQEYEEFKNKFKDRMINKFKELFPGVNITYSNIATPLSYQHYFNTLQGKCYGLSMTRERYYSDELIPDTPIKNFYLSGQDICTLGFTGAMSSGLLSVCSMVDTVDKMRLIRGLVL
jgi:all-trans-retinol 13,14-reductase